MIEIVGCLIMASFAGALFLATISLGAGARPSQPEARARPTAPIGLADHHRPT
jgi:hypothetical protein